MPQERHAKKSKGAPLKPLQNWKITVGLAVVLIAAIVVAKEIAGDRKGSSAELPPQAANIVKEIGEFQKVVDANPQDAQATLRLANLLHDVRFYPRAIMMYEHYLEMNPKNADAIVDLGISHFELSMTDSLHREEHLTTAKAEMERAITIEPKHQLAHFNLGIVSLHTGDITEANEWFKKSVEINPNSETARKAQQLLNQHSFNNP